MIRVSVASSCINLQASCPLEGELLNPTEAEAKGIHLANLCLSIVCVQVSSPAVIRCEQSLTDSEELRLDPQYLGSQRLRTVKTLADPAAGLSEAPLQDPCESTKRHSFTQGPDFLTILPITASLASWSPCL